MSHEKYVKVIGAVLNFYPGVYLLLILVVPPLILGIVLGSSSVFIVATIVHVGFVIGIRHYLAFWRTTTYGLRLVYTILLHRFLFHLSQAVGLNTVYIDISDAQSVEEVYQQQRRSIRKRMNRNIPEQVAEAKVEVNNISSNRITIENLKVQYFHAKKYNTTIFPVYRIVLGLFTLTGNVIEYRINGKLVGQGLSFLRGDAYTIFQYGCLDEASKIGLWFYNIIENVKQAISMNAQLINGTIENHKPEAKHNAGFISTNDEDLVFRLYGGNFLNLPRAYKE